LRIEHSRKHGPFDRRFPPIRRKPAPASLWSLGEERLDWQRFVARFFPGSRRHDLDALAAYESYRKDADRRTADGFLAADTERWEGEGGALAAATSRDRSIKSRDRTQPATDARPKEAIHATTAAR
jgi:hypothetical protein